MDTTALFAPLRYDYVLERREPSLFAEPLSGYFLADAGAFHNDVNGGVYLVARYYRQDGKFIKPNKKLAWAVYALSLRLSDPIAHAEEFTPLRRKRTRPIDERISLAPLLDGLRDFRVYHDGDLREIDGSIIPPVRDRVLTAEKIFSCCRKVAGKEIAWLPGYCFMQTHDIDIYRTKSGAYFEHDVDAGDMWP